MFALHIGSFIRMACGKRHEDTQNIYKYAVLFITLALVLTFIFDSGSHFLGSCPPVTRQKLNCHGWCKILPVSHKLSSLAEPTQAATPHTTSTPSRTGTCLIPINNGDESSDDSVEHSEIDHLIFALFHTHRGVSEAERSYIQAYRNERKRHRHQTRIALQYFRAAGLLSASKRSLWCCR